MAQIATAFWLAGCQALRLPQEFWFDGQELSIERYGAFIVLSPVSGPVAAAPEQPAMPPPGVTFAGFLGPRPIPHRSAAETLAEVRRLFAQTAANDNKPIGRAETPMT